MASFILVPILLLAHSTTVYATQETNDLVVITTANHLRKEIKSQLDETHPPLLLRLLTPGLTPIILQPPVWRSFSLPLNLPLVSTGSESPNMHYC